MEQKVAKLPILAWPDFNMVFQVEDDGSGSAIVVAQSQEGKAISFYSEKMNYVKRKNSVYDQEFYAIIQALKKWNII